MSGFTRSNFKYYIDWLSCLNENNRTNAISPLVKSIIVESLDFMVAEFSGEFVNGFNQMVFFTQGDVKIFYRKLCLLTIKCLMKGRI